MLPILRILPVGGVIIVILLLALAVSPPDGPRAQLVPNVVPARGALLVRADHPEWRQFLMLAAIQRADELNRLRELPNTPTRADPKPVAPKIGDLPTGRSGSKPEGNAETGSIAPGTIVGAASMYDPFRPGYDEGRIETASGELYDLIAWTAAIQIDLRETFGGVRNGKDYRPAYALIEAAGKRAIIKINDVGPLKPGRIIDFNERTMHYFDPSLQRGIVHSVKITPLPGNGWAPGPFKG